MAMKRTPVPPASAKKPARRKAKAPAAAADGAPSAAGRPDPKLRWELIAAEAYFLAERRGFAAGHELADWSAAEAMIDSRQQEA